MAQTYRTDDFARWGAGQGFNLSPAQVDNNFWDLIQRMIAQEARPDPSAGIAYFEIVGVMMYVHMTDGSVLGPYELPVAIFRDRGTWTISTVYSKMDTFQTNGGLYVVIWDHTSGTTFDPGANDGAGHDYYQLMLQTPGSSLPSGGAVGQLVQKASTTDYAVRWGYTDASVVSFEPPTGSGLSSTNVADALEELSDNISAVIVHAVNVTYAPSTASGLTAINVQAALDELGSSGGGGGASPSNANPGMDGTAAPGTSALYSRGDHIHPTDTSRAPLASPTFTGVATFAGTAAPTATVGTNTTQLATTAFVQAAIPIGNIPQNSQSSAYTTVLVDAQKHIFHPSADTTARTWTIDSNANVAYPLGTAITFVNQNAGGAITIAIASDTMRLAGAGTTGSRTLAPNGIATALKVAATEWIISGTGLT